MGQVLGVLLLFHLLLTAVLSADLLLRHKEPVATMAWLQGITFFPFLGAAVYLVFGAGSFQRRKYRRRRRQLGALDIGPPGSRSASFRRRLDELPSRSSEALTLAAATSRCPPTDSNRAEVYDNVSQLYDDLEAAIRAARRHIHFECYLFQPDDTGRRFLKLLAEKAGEGVEVRLLLDAVGSRGLSEAHLAPLLAAGGKAAWFLPLRAFARIQALHLRNHRKVAVIDGAVAFTGGTNIGDEYRGRRASRAHWRDTHLRIRGPAVGHLQEVFAEDWWFAAEEKLIRDDYFPPLEPAGDDVVQVVASGPDDPASAIHATLFHAIATAQERVWIATPYFIPDAPIATALETAALRGVDVRLLLPDRSDHPLVDRAGESFLPALLAAGGRVYRYEAGMLHSKLVAVDGRLGTLGSANMDIRSFRLNFEVNLMLFSPGMTRRIEAIIEKDLVQSRAVGRSGLAAAPLLHRVAVAACRCLAPLL